MKIRIEIFFIAFCLSAANIFAQARASEIIENSLQAIGGRKEIAKIQNIRAIADCTGPNGKYTTGIYSADNSRLIFRQVKQNGDVYQGQTNGQFFWKKNEKTGEFSLAGRREVFVWRSHNFQKIALSLDEFFRELSFAGEENFKGKTAVKLRGKDELGNRAELFFDKETGLMLGFDIQNPFKSEPEKIRTSFDEWRKIGAIKLPSKVTATDTQGDFVLNFREIVLNKTDEKIFAAPLQVKAMNELLDIHNEQRAAHFNRDAKLLVSVFADDFTDIGRGKIRKPTREESFNRFQTYFKNSTFLEWDDITPPVIKVSDDATLGYTIVHKKVRLLAQDENGKEQEETEVFAWIAVYQKNDGKWKLTAIASTNTPETDR